MSLTLSMLLDSDKNLKAPMNAGVILRIVQKLR